jgi:hypothetical protein
MELFVSPSGNDQAVGDVAAPLASLAGAIARLPGMAETAPNAQLQVLIRGGIYHIEQPLLIERKHVPPRGSLKFAAADGELVVISGGRRIAGGNVNGDGTWSLKIPEAVNGRWAFRELFVNGERRPRARHPNAEYARIDAAFEDKRSSFTFTAGDLPTSWTGGGELVFLHDWSTSRIPVKEVDHDTRRLAVAFPIGCRSDHFQIDHFEPHPRYFVEGHREFLDAPGEWLLDGDGQLSTTPCPLVR